MGFSLKSVGNLAGKALGASVGAFFGGPTGAVAGYNGANSVLGAVGLGDDQIAAEEQWKWQKKASDYAFNQNLQMWNLANAYNDPAAQMQRLAAAKLNPNLVYQGGNVAGNTSGSAPTYERPNVKFSDRSVQREQLALAMQEFRQRVTNQAIENDLARQRLVLAERDADRSDMLADAQVKAYAAGLGLTGARIGDIEFKHNTYDRRPVSVREFDYWSEKARPYTEPVGRKVGEINAWATEKANAYKNSWFHKMLRR